MWMKGVSQSMFEARVWLMGISFSNIGTVGREQLIDVYKRQEQVILSDKESKGGYYE